MRNQIDHRILKELNLADSSNMFYANNVLNMISRSRSKNHLKEVVSTRPEKLNEALERLIINGDIICLSKKCEDFHVNYQITHQGKKSYLNKVYAEKHFELSFDKLPVLIEIIILLFKFFTSDYSVNLDVHFVIFMILRLKSLLWSPVFLQENPVHVLKWLFNFQLALQFFLIV